MVLEAGVRKVLLPTEPPNSLEEFSRYATKRAKRKIDRDVKISPPFKAGFGRR